MNPTTQVLEERLAALEGGAAALAVASGSSAVVLAIQNVASAGDNIVASPHLYGGTYNLFTNTLKNMGIEVRFADPENPESFRELSDSKTRAYFGETLPNPKLVPFPIEEVAAIGHALGIPLIVDNTAAPITCRPFDHGAAIIVHSLTKYIGGHSISLFFCQSFVVQFFTFCNCNVNFGNAFGIKINFCWHYSKTISVNFSNNFINLFFI